MTIFLIFWTNGLNGQINVMIFVVLIMGLYVDIVEKYAVNKDAIKDFLSQLVAKMIKLLIIMF
jgi:hypothetical protein